MAEQEAIDAEKLAHAQELAAIETEKTARQAEKEAVNAAVEAASAEEVRNFSVVVSRLRNMK